MNNLSNAEVPLPMEPILNWGLHLYQKHSEMIRSTVQTSHCLGKVAQEGRGRGHNLAVVAARS